MLPSPFFQNLSASWRLPPKDNPFARIVSAACLVFNVKTSVDRLMAPLSNRTASMSPFIHRGAYGS